jgi:hypothetical protein
MTAGDDTEPAPEGDSPQVRVRNLKRLPTGECWFDLAMAF